MKALFAGLALTAFLALVGAIDAATSTPIKVSSTLDGKTVLPHRIHWLGYPSFAQSKVAKVEFLIDGRLAWVEHSAPYVYGSDDNGRREGYLVTSWLSPGKHRFAVRVTGKDGTTGNDTVVARVLPAPAPPAALSGTWQRTIDAA